MPPLRGSEFGALRPPQTLKARASTTNSRPDLLEPALSRMLSTSEAFAQIVQSQNRVDKCKIDDAVGRRLDQGTTVLSICAITQMIGGA